MRAVGLRREAPTTVAETTTARLADLAAAVAALGDDGEEDWPDDVLDAADRARTVLRRAGERRALSAAHTVVALGGATGSGKSSLVNALVGQACVTVGVRRPTTAHPVAAVLGEADGAAELLDWLDVPLRHVVAAGEPDGLVLLDLPDMDSVEAAHARTVDRLAQVVDVLVWVLDPQKYADNVLHQRYLRPMATHAPVTLVVLNQADMLGPQERAAVLADVDALLADDGLGGVHVHLTSAVTGEGLDDLREDLGAVVAERSAAEARLGADARAAALGLLAVAGSPEPAGVDGHDRDALTRVLAEAAGVDVVADAVGRSYRMSARAATGWPVTRWLGRLRPDPLRRLGLARQVVDPELVRSSVPRPTAVQRARVDGAVRDLARAAAEGTSEPWRGRIRAAAVRSAPSLGDALDQAIVSTRLETERTPRWWAAVGAVQWAALAVALAGLVWLAVLAVVGYLQLPELPVPRLGVVPWPTVLTVGGIVLGLLLALGSGLTARAGARRRAAKVRRRLGDAVARVAEHEVVAPVLAEVERCARVNRAARRAAG